MKRIRVLKQTEEYYEVPDNFELNELTYKELSPCISIVQSVQVLNISDFLDEKVNQINE